MSENGAAELPGGGKARRVYLLLRDEIANGRKAGEVLPGEQRLAAEFGVSRVTVRRALDALARDGLIERRAGSGTVVRRAVEPAPPVAEDLASLMPQIAAIGATSARLLSFRYGPAPERVRAALDLGPGDRVQTAERVRLVEGRPYSHLTTHVPEQIARHYSEADLATTPLYRLLERGGVRIGTAEQSVSATLAGPEVAQALEVATGSALLWLSRVVRDEVGRGVEYLSALYRPDLFRLDMTLSRVGEGAARHWEPRIGGENGTETGG